jgi:hypothetical protein
MLYTQDWVHAYSERLSENAGSSPLTSYLRGWDRLLPFQNVQISLVIFVHSLQQETLSGSGLQSSTTDLAYSSRSLESVTVACVANKVSSAVTFEMAYSAVGPGEVTPADARMSPSRSAPPAVRARGSPGRRRADVPEPYVPCRQRSLDTSAFLTRRVSGLGARPVTARRQQTAGKHKIASLCTSAIDQHRPYLRAVPQCNGVGLEAVGAGVATFTGGHPPSVSHMCRGVDIYMLAH